MSVLDKNSLLEELDKPYGSGLIVTPCLSPKDQLCDCSIDVRLGHEFIVTKKTELVSLDLLGQPWEFEEDVARYQTRVRRRTGEPFVLHPREFVLGATLEYLSMPETLYAQALGKSSLGRLGLVIATATGVAPGFKGCITLELSNVGIVPLEMYPGMRIAQLVFFTMNGKAKYSGSYDCPTGPQFSKLSDKDTPFLRKPRIALGEK